jgi:hypothetical protein
MIAQRAALGGILGRWRNSILSPGGAKDRRNPHTLQPIASRRKHRKQTRFERRPAV